MTFRSHLFQLNPIPTKKGKYEPIRTMEGIALCWIDAISEYYELPDMWSIFMEVPVKTKATRGSFHQGLPQGSTTHIVWSLSILKKCYHRSSLLFFVSFFEFLLSLTWPGLGIGSRWSLKELGPNRCVVSLRKSFGRFIIEIASNGHFLTQMPQPMQRVSEMNAIFDVGSTSMHIFPVRFTGQFFLHSWRHFFGLQRSELTIAILKRDSSTGPSLFASFLGAILAEEKSQWNEQ